jgi:hypothetical protein
MADSAQVRTQLQIFLQKRSAKRVKNTLFNVMPLLEFFFALSGDKEGADDLGRPKSTGIMIGALSGVAKVRREKIYAEREYLPIIQTTAPAESEVKSMSDYDSDPTVVNWSTDNAPLKRFKQPRFKFARKKIPYKIPHSDVRTARSGAGAEGQASAAIKSVYDVEVKTRTAVLCKNLNSELWGINGQPGFPTDEDATQWDHLHSIQQALRADNVYAGIDRTLAANAYWRGNYDTTPRSFTFEDMIEFCNYDLGMIDKGLGVQVIAVGKALMKKAKAEAKTDSYTLCTNGIPEFPEYGFKRDVVRIHSGNRPVYVVYDPGCPAGHAACLDPSTWTVAIHPDSNFKVSKPSDQTEVEGGDEADTGTIAVEAMLACEVPSGNAYFTAIS